jgi:type I restriction enzyme M protein
MFYNTGIATYVWVLTNRKPDHRREKVQLIDATQWFKPLRKNLGSKNCELSPQDIERICETYLAFNETEQSKILQNAAFGYWKVVVERPLRLHTQLTVKAIESLHFASGDEDIRILLYEEFGDALFNGFLNIQKPLEERLATWGTEEADEAEENGAIARTLSQKKKKKLLDARTWERDARLVDIATTLREELGGELFEDHNKFREDVQATLKNLKLKVSASDLKIILRGVSWRVEDAPPVIAKVYKAGKVEANALYGRYEIESESKRLIVEYEPDSELRDNEQIPLLEPGGIEAFIRREVLPYVPDAWIREEAKIGYEISFTRHFYKPQPLRPLEEIRADIMALENETEGILSEIIGAASP